MGLATKRSPTVAAPSLETEDFDLKFFGKNFDWHKRLRVPAYPSKHKHRYEYNRKQYVKNGDFLSDTLRFHYPAVDKETSAKWAHLDRIALTRWGKETGKKLVTFKFLEDNGKAPMNNKPASAMLSLQALNAFFSNNIAANSNGTVDRRAYGYLVAHVTGLDQRKCKVYRVFDEIGDGKHHSAGASQVWVRPSKLP